MVRKCWACFKGCGAGEKITLHKFPKDEIVRRQWILATGRKNFEPSNTSVLCSRHFTPECFTYGKSGCQKRIFIKPQALPTIFPPITQSKRSKMRSMMLPVSFRGKSIGNVQPHQSMIASMPIKQEYEVKEEFLIKAEPTALATTDDLEHTEYLEEQSSSMDWVSHFDRSENSSVPNDRDISSVLQPKQETNYEEDDDVHKFKSRRKILANLNMALNYIANQRKELKIVKQKNRLLEKRLSILKALLTHVLTDKILSDESDSESESEIWSG